MEGQEGEQDKYVGGGARCSVVGKVALVIHARILSLFPGLDLLRKVLLTFTADMGLMTSIGGQIVLQESSDCLLLTI